MWAEGHCLFGLPEDYRFMGGIWLSKESVTAQKSALTRQNKVWGSTKEGHLIHICGLQGRHSEEVTHKWRELKSVDVIQMEMEEVW